MRSQYKSKATTGETTTWEAWEDATWELRELHLFLDGFLDAGLPVFVEAFVVGIVEGQTVGEPFLQDGNLFVVATDAIVGKHADGIELEATFTKATFTKARKTAKHAEAALLLSGLL